MNVLCVYNKIFFVIYSSGQINRKEEETNKKKRIFVGGDWIVLISIAIDLGVNFGEGQGTVYTSTKTPQ